LRLPYDLREVWAWGRARAWLEAPPFSPAPALAMDEMLRDAPSAEDWRGRFGQSAQTQRQRAAERIEQRRQKLRGLEARVAEQLEAIGQQLTSQATESQAACTQAREQQEA